MFCMRVVYQDGSKIVPKAYESILPLVRPRFHYGLCEDRVRDRLGNRIPVWGGHGEIAADLEVVVEWRGRETEEREQKHAKECGLNEYDVLTDNCRVPTRSCTGHVPVCVHTFRFCLSRASQPETRPAQSAPSPPTDLHTVLETRVVDHRDDAYSPPLTSQTRSKSFPLYRWLIAVHHYPTTKTQRRDSPCPRGKSKTRWRRCHYQNVSQGLTALVYAPSLSHSTQLSIPMDSVSPGSTIPLFPGMTSRSFPLHALLIILSRGEPEIALRPSPSS